VGIEIFSKQFGWREKCLIDLQDFRRIDMNVDSARFPSLPVQGVAGEVPPSLATDGAMSDGFADTLMARIEMLIGSKGYSLPESPQEAGRLENINASLTGLPLDKARAQELAALFGKNLPAASEINASEDLEAMLATLKDTLMYVAQGGAAQGMAAPELEGGELEKARIDDKIEAVMKPAGQDAAVIVMVPEQTAVYIQKEPASEDQFNDQVADAQVSDALLTAVDASPVAMLSAQETIGNDLARAAASQEKTVPALTKAMPEAGQPRASGEDAVSADFGQQEAVLEQTLQREPGSELSSPGKEGKAEKPTQSEGQLPVIDGEKTLPRVTADLKQVMDNKIDMPAITKPIAHPDWHQELGERIIWMSNKAITAAEIKLNPQQLGPVSVRVDVNQDQASVAFTAQNAAVREALEAAIPKLRDMMSAQQLNLADVNVAQNFSSGQGQSHRFSQTADARTHGTVPIAVDAAEELASGRAAASNGLLSLYA
jgi:flagellar hook-length control protein FliK